MVRFGDVTAVGSAWGDTLLDLSVPFTAQTGMVRVTARGLTSNPLPFSVVVPQEPVVIALLEPARTTVSDIITIWGSGFRSETIPPIVTFQGGQGRLSSTVTTTGPDWIRGRSRRARSTVR